MPTLLNLVRLASGLLSLQREKSLRSLIRPARLVLAVLGGFLLLSLSQFVMVTQGRVQVARSFHPSLPGQMSLAGSQSYSGTMVCAVLSGDPGLACDRADLGVEKTVSDSTPREGDTIVYTVTVTNHGPDKATSVQLTDELPAGVTYITHTVSQGTYTDTWWTMPSLANGATVTMTITAAVDKGTNGQTITNTATGLVADQADKNSVNNKASVVITPTSDAHYLYLPLICKVFEPLICESYSDDFSNPNSGWPVDGDGDVRTGYTASNEYFIYRKIPGMRIAQAPTEFANLYSVEVDVHWGGANPGYEYGLVFGQTSFPVPTYRFGVDPVNRRFRIRRHNGSDWACINQSDPCWVRSSFIEPGSTSNHLKVECDGKGIGVYVNDNLLWQSNRNIPSCAGHVGVFAQSVTADTAVAYFDNFEVGCPTGENSLNILGRGQSSLSAVSAELEVDE